MLRVRVANQDWRVYSLEGYECGRSSASSPRLLPSGVLWLRAHESPKGCDCCVVDFVLNLAGD